MHLLFCDTRIKSEGANHQHFLWKYDDYSKTEKENKNRRHGFRGKLSDNKLVKFQLNRFRDCRLGVENVRLTFRNFLSEKTRKKYFLRHLTRHRIILTTWPGAHFSKVPKRLPTQKAAANTQTLITNTELFYSHIRSLHTGTFRWVRLSVLKYGLTENVSGDWRETDLAPRPSQLDW